MAENQPEMAEDMDSVMLGVTSRDMNYQSLNLRYGTNFLAAALASSPRHDFTKCLGTRATILRCSPFERAK